MVPKMNISDLLQELLDASTSEASRRALESDLRVFNTWYRSSENGENIPLPASELTVAEFIADQSESKATATIIRYVSSLSRIHEMSGWANPTKTELVRKAVQGLRKSKGVAGKQAPALSGEQLITILGSFRAAEWSEQRNKAIFAIGWSAALRCSELHFLNLEDVEKDGENIILNIRKSKTDQSGIGKKIGIPSSPITQIIDHWTNMIIGLYRMETGPLFPSFSRASADRYFPKPGVKNRLSIRGISKVVRTVLGNNNLPGSVHSMRRGMITEAARSGVPERVIQRHSRHASTRILRSYVEDGDLFVDNPLPLVFERIFGRTKN